MNIDEIFVFFTGNHKPNLKDFTDRSISLRYYNKKQKKIKKKQLKKLKEQNFISLLNQKFFV